MNKNNFSLYGLPEAIKFCKKCVISNQRPSSVVEFKNKDNINIEKIISNMNQYDIKVSQNNMIQLSLDNEELPGICTKIKNLVNSIY